MMMGRLFLSLLLALTVVAIGPSATLADPTASDQPAPNQQVLGRDGTVYRLLDETYGYLFAQGSEAPADSRVLALEVTDPEGQVTRLLVPQTTSRSAELAPQLVYVQSSDTLFLLWEGIFNQLHPLLYLASFQDGAWIDVLEITGDPFARKGQPQLVVTRDVNRLSGGDTIRTTLHTVWWEEAAGGTLKRYAPIVIENGTRRTWHPTWNLSSFVGALEGAPINEHSQVVHIAPGPKHNSVLVGFMTTAGDRVVTLEVEVLPTALGDLGDAIRIHLDVEGLRAGSLEALADSLAQFIRVHGEGFHEASLEFLAESSRAALLEARLPLAGSSISELSDTARIHIINEGVRIGTHGLEDDGAFEIIEIERPDRPGSFHLLKVSTLSERPSPVGVGANADLYLSVDGKNAILAWETDDSVIYVESSEDGWGPERRLPLGESYSLTTARQMLETLAQSR